MLRLNIFHLCKPRELLTLTSLQAVIKASGGITGKGKEFWTVVANNMEENITWNAARKRFNKFKPATEDGNVGGGAGEAEAPTVKKAATKGKADPAKSKAVKATGKGKGKKEETENEGAEDESQKGDDAEGATTGVCEDDTEEDNHGTYPPIFSSHSKSFRGFVEGPLSDFFSFLNHEFVSQTPQEVRLTSDFG